MGHHLPSQFSQKKNLPSQSVHQVKPQSTAPQKTEPSTCSRIRRASLSDLSIVFTPESPPPTDSHKILIFEQELAMTTPATH